MIATPHRLVGAQSRSRLRRQAFVVSAGVYAVRTLPLDAIPDLSDVQVIVYTEYPGPGAAGGRGSGHLSPDHAPC